LKTVRRIKYKLPLYEIKPLKLFEKNFREISPFQQDVVPLGQKHTTIWGKKSSPNVKFI